MKNKRSIPFLVYLLYTAPLRGLQAVPIPDGLWRIACAQGLTKTQEVLKNQTTLTETFHRDFACTLPSVKFMTRGTVKYKEGTNHIDFAYSSIDMTAYDLEFINHLNQRKVCDLDNWQIGQSQKITGLKCALFNVSKPSAIPAAGDMKYGIYKIEDEHLYFGQMRPEKNGSSPQNRPEEFDPAYYKLDR